MESFATDDNLNYTILTAQQNVTPLRIFSMKSITITQLQ